MRIAMWSGPRNLSTAMMYSFGARIDCAVCDEPFYAAYLKETKLAHPMADEIIQKHMDEIGSVISYCSGPIPNEKQHFYLKLMAHHMLDEFPTDWARNWVNVHLIRHPARVIASYAAKREDPTLEDIGFAQQLAIYEKLGGVVIDSHDIRENPEMMLQMLCAEIGIPFSDSMLRWHPGGREEDGIWARHWYGAVHQSSGFAGPEKELPSLTGEYATLCKAALPDYEGLKIHALRQNRHS